MDFPICENVGEQFTISSAAVFPSLDKRGVCLYPLSFIISLINVDLQRSEQCSLTVHPIVT